MKTPPPFLVLVGCSGCGGTGRVPCGSEHTAPCGRCHGEADWYVDLAVAVGGDGADFIGLYGSFLPDQAEHVTEYACLVGFTWWEVDGAAAPSWLTLPEGPSKAEFEDERRERAPLAKTYPTARERGTGRLAG